MTNAKLADGAVDSAKVADFGLRLRDFGGIENQGTVEVSQAFTVNANTCSQRFLDLYNPAPSGIIGSLVVGHLTTPRAVRCCRTQGSSFRR